MIYKDLFMFQRQKPRERRVKGIDTGTPFFISRRFDTTKRLIGLRTKMPILEGIESLVTIKGDLAPYKYYLIGTDTTDMAADWNMVGKDIRMAIQQYSR